MKQLTIRKNIAQNKGTFIGVAAGLAVSAAIFASTAPIYETIRTQHTNARAKVEAFLPNKPAPTKEDCESSLLTNNPAAYDSLMALVAQVNVSDCETAVSAYTRSHEEFLSIRLLRTILVALPTLLTVCFAVASRDIKATLDVAMPKPEGEKI